MKRGKPLSRKTPLRATKGLRRGNGPTRAANVARTNPTRREKLFRRCFHSEEFVMFTKSQRCVCRGMVCDGENVQTSHDPTRGAGGTWMDTHPASKTCHDLIEANDFWHRIGRTREEANREHHMNWLEHQDLMGEPYSDDDTCECGHTYLLWKETDRHQIFVCGGPGHHQWFVQKATPGRRAREVAGA